MTRPRCAAPPSCLRLFATAAVFSVAVPATHAQTAAEPIPRATVDPAAASRLVPFEARLNGRALGTWTLLQRNGVLYLRVADLSVWGLRAASNVLVREERGQVWYPLATIPGAELRVSQADNQLEMRVPDRSMLPAGLPPLAPSGSAAQQPASPRAPETRTGPRLLPLAVLVNGSRAGNWVLLEQDGVLYAPEDALQEWRVTRSAHAVPLDIRGQRWYPLSSVPGFSAQIDTANQSVDLRFSPQAFSATRLAQDVVQRPVLSPAIPAAFLNYDLNFTTDAGRGTPTNHELGALLEVGASNGWGALTSSFVGTGLLGSTAAGGAQWRRIETTLSRDFPQQNITARIGDSSTRAGIGGRSAYFGGVQIARNFGLTPGFITQPIPLVTGVSSAPSTVELYINDTLRQTSRVPAGPFSIENLPALTGSGQARVVVRDLLGRETVLVQDFFTDTSLLEKGLSDWSFQAGALRRNLLLESNDYGQRFASGLFRHGLTNSQTLEARAEAGQDTQGLALALTTTLSTHVIGQVSAARSHDQASGGGYQGTLGLEQRSLRHGFSARVEAATPGYRQLGYSSGFLPPRTTATFSYNYMHPTLGNFGAAYAHSISSFTGTLNSYTLNYGTRIGEASSLSLMLTRVTGASDGRAIGISFVVPLGGSKTSSSNATYRDGQTDTYTSIVAPLTQETGFGGRAVAGTRAGRGYSEGGLYYQGGKGFASADVSASGAQQSVRLGARGGVAVADAQVFAARRIEDSFAVVEVPGYAGIGVGFQGSSLTRTDANGVAILPRLRAYDTNSIRLDPRELPINAELDTIEQLAVPAARSAVKVVFPVRRGRGALVKLVLDDGLAVPAGAEVELVGDGKEFFVARRGEAFITGLQSRNDIRVRHNGQQCAVVVVLPPAAEDEIARVGPLTCSGVKR